MFVSQTTENETFLFFLNEPLVVFRGVFKCRDAALYYLYVVFLHFWRHILTHPPHILYLELQPSLHFHTVFLHCIVFVMASVKGALINQKTKHAAADLYSWEKKTKQLHFALKLNIKLWVYW